MAKTVTLKATNFNQAGKKVEAVLKTVASTSAIIEALEKAADATEDKKATRAFTSQANKLTKLVERQEKAIADLQGKLVVEGEEAPAKAKGKAKAEKAPAKAKGKAKAKAKAEKPAAKTKATKAKGKAKAKAEKPAAKTKAKGKAKAKATAKPARKPRSKKTAPKGEFDFEA
tara:strand:+ start:35706 stop:36221 length:516 start_codon:yes stop_codon:yes gene_type:complete